LASTKLGPSDEPYANATVQGWWRILKEMLQDAAAEFGLPDPTRRVRAPKTDIAKARERRALTRAELDSVLDAVGSEMPDWFAEVYVLAFSGMRPGELYALEWGDIDESAGVIHIRRAVWRGVVAGTKTGAERRAVLTSGMRRVLHGRRGLPGALVFPSATGGYRGPQSLLTMLRRLCARCGLPRVTPYTFRYTFRTLMRDAGAPDELVRAVQGHASAEMGERYYRVDVDGARRLVEALELPDPSPRFRSRV